jgi:transcriptional regulator with XRE-family HTH domain
MTKTEAIKWAGGSVTDLAQRLGISQPAISQWEGDTVPELQQHRLALLSEGELRVDAKYLPKPASFVKLA